MSEELGKCETTTRGFEFIRFTDRYGEECSVQQSSTIGDEVDASSRPGSSMLWLGPEQHRMHLTKTQVAQLALILTRWVETGHLKPVEQGTIYLKPVDNPIILRTTEE